MYLSTPFSPFLSNLELLCSRYRCMLFPFVGELISVLAFKVLRATTIVRVLTVSLSQRLVSRLIHCRSPQHQQRCAPSPGRHRHGTPPQWPARVPRRDDEARWSRDARDAGPDTPPSTRHLGQAGWRQEEEDYAYIWSLWCATCACFRLRGRVDHIYGDQALKSDGWHTDFEWSRARAFNDLTSSGLCWQALSCRTPSREVGRERSAWEAEWKDTDMVEIWDGTGRTES